MESSPAPAVNASLPGVMLSVTEIARRDGKSVAAVSKRVKRLVERHQLEVQTDVDGRVVAVNVVHFDELTKRFGDPSKAQATPPDQAPKPASLDDARIRQAYYGSELDRLKLGREIGSLVPKADIEFAIEDTGDEIARAFESLTGTADELAAAYEHGGQQALRIKLKELVHTAREKAADALDKLVTQAPETVPAVQSPAQIAAE